MTEIEYHRKAAIYYLGEGQWYAAYLYHSEILMQLIKAKGDKTE